jgi:hypothetical protein
MQRAIAGIDFSKVAFQGMLFRTLIPPTDPLVARG